jgi:hypothetical protein
MATENLEMLYVYGVNPKLWAKRFDIQPIEAPCQICGRVLITDLPLVIGPFRGLAINCPCGSRVPYCFVRAIGDLWDNL